MITVGIRGRIGAGKSTVAHRLGELGAHVIDADAIAHEVLEEADAKAEIVDRFGPGVLAADGTVDRGRLAALVFGPTPHHVAARAALEGIVHPRVHRRIEQALAAVREAERAAGRSDTVVVLDVPLLVRSGWDMACDWIVAIECEDRVRRERLARRGVSAEAQAARDAAWEHPRPDGAGVPPAGGPKSEFRVDTSGELSYTRSQVDRIWSALPRT